MLKLNVGFQRKVGEAAYGSRGASVHLELELDSGLAQEPTQLQQRVRQLFHLAEAAVDRQLHEAAPASPLSPPTPSSNSAANPLPVASATPPPWPRRRDATRPATASQVRALHALAERQGLDLTARLQADYQIDEPQRLSITEASQLIDQLKGTHQPAGSRR